MNKLILIAMIIGFTCQARIGETEAECEKRYGEPTGAGNLKLYGINKINIVIFFIDGICKEIHYRKITNNRFGKGIFSNPQILELLKRNSDQMWIPTAKNEIEIKLRKPLTGANNCWLTKDKKIVAVYSGSNNKLSIINKEAKKELDDVGKKEIEGL